MKNAGAIKRCSLVRGHTTSLFPLQSDRYQQCGTWASSPCKLATTIKRRFKRKLDLQDRWRTHGPELLLQKWCSCLRGCGRGWYGYCLEFSICGVTSRSFNFPRKISKLSQSKAQSSVATQTLSPVTELSPTPIRSTHKSLHTFPRPTLMWSYLCFENKIKRAKSQTSEEPKMEITKKRPSNDGRAKCGVSRRWGTTQPWEVCMVKGSHG